jgi:N-methylhydantoinase B/oxoprolinase/acetone carboxylase alpha subunit
MDGTVWRSSRSTIVRETLGYSSAIYDRDGFNVAQSVHIPQHLNSMGYALRRIVDDFIPLADWQDGDVVIASDPYCGGQHLPDILAFRPVFHEGARVAIVGTLCHHLDVAGMSPLAAPRRRRPRSTRKGCASRRCASTGPGAATTRSGRRHPPHAGRRLRLRGFPRLGASAQAVPERMPAAYHGCSYVCSFQTETADQRRNVLVEIEIGGCGALPDEDGANAFNFGMHNNANIPLEMIEAGVPLSFAGHGLLPDSGGAGARRGGLGLYHRAWRVDAERATLTAQMDRFRFQPYGLAGGGPGAPGRLALIRDGVRTELHSKVSNLSLRRGDIIRLETSGGGGYGDPRARDTADSARDAALGYVTAGR